MRNCDKAILRNKHRRLMEFVVCVKYLEYSSQRYHILQGTLKDFTNKLAVAGLPVVDCKRDR